MVQVRWSSNPSVIIRVANRNRTNRQNTNRPIEVYCECMLHALMETENFYNLLSASWGPTDAGGTAPG